MRSKSHRISIPSILDSSENSIKNIGYLLNREKFTKVAVFYDKHMKEVLESEISNILNKENIKFNTYVIENNDFYEITQNAFSIPNDIDAIIAIGGGKVLDASKYMGFLRKLPFISIPTSTSNDGFSSPVASLLINDKRTTVPAKMPYGIIVDTNIIKNAPDSYIYSGIGDLISNITALWDWRFEEENKKSRIEDFAMMISKKSVDSFLGLEFKSIKDKEFIQSLVDSLIMSGIAMEISQSSAPSSGSEHLISHALDYIIDKPYLHGVQVGIATYIISKIQNNKTQEILDFFEITGFWNYISTLKIKKEYFLKAIDLAPSVKPQRYTAIHLEKNRDLAKKIINTDTNLKNILH